MYLVGSSMASLACAVYLIKDAGVSGKNIHILEQDNIVGGSCDGAGDADTGFIIRGGRMHEAHYVCYWDLLSNIPSYDDPNFSVKDESFAFSQRFVSNSHARLLKGGKKVNVSTFGLSFKHKIDLLKLSLVSEKSLGRKKIEDWFDQKFFVTNFWYIWASIFAFQKWSSLAEMRRYMRRFIHLIDGLNRLGGVMRTKYNQYHSVIVPLQRYLQEHGVNFHMRVQVTDIDFNFSAEEKKATALHCIDKNGNEDKSSSGSWMLWENIAKKNKAFGNPGIFSDDIDAQKWYSFTATLNDTTFHDYMERFTGNVDGTSGLVTIIDSNWLMSIVIARQPHFPNQPDEVKIFWGCGLYPDREGNHIKKKMSECNGEEILDELWHHLNIQDLMKPISASKKINYIPVAMPFIDSLFMPLQLGDRPDVLPVGAANFAFLGQFTELPDDCVFTVEYSVRSAQTAVYGLFNTGKDVMPIYDSIHDPNVLLTAIKAIFR